MSENTQQSKAETLGSDLPFDTIVETINEGIFIVGLNSELVYANQRFGEMLGYTPEQMVGQPVFDFMTDYWADEARAALRRRRQGIEEVFDHRWLRKDGEQVWTLVSAKPMYDEEGVDRGSLVAVQDISERKRMEEELRQARDKLEERVEERTEQLVQANNKLKEEIEVRREAEEKALEASRAKSAFLANMSHELRTPLNAVIGYTELVEEELSFAKDSPETLSVDALIGDLDKVHRAAKHLLSLINDILDLSKVEAGKMDLHIDAFEVSELVQEVIDTVHPLIEEQDNEAAVSLEFEGDIVADRTKLKQVLINLVGNAAKFTEDGRIEVATREADVNGMRGVRIDVSDTGVGIPQEELERLFEPFTQADESTTRKHGGTGLGLTICKRFCEMLGGYIDVESTVGEGSTFSVYLPVNEQREGLMEQSSVRWAPGLDLGVEAPSPGAGGPSVLVIDDDPHVHELMRRFLGPMGFEIYPAFEGEEGLKRAREVEPDVITLDVMMPGRDGWSVLSNLKADKELESIPVVMVTMIDDKSIGYALGASDYLVKPIEKERLVRVLSRFQQSKDAQALIVEDEANIRELMARHLRKTGWTVETAENGQIALDKLDEKPFDVVILDLMMPEMDGFEVADIMRQEPRWQDIPIVVVTAMELDEAEQQRLEKSVERILTKEAITIDRIVTEVLEVTGADVEAPEQDKTSKAGDEFVELPAVES